MPLHGEIVVIKRNGTDGTRFPLTATSCLFGRKTECDIRIQLPHVSKEHCKVEVKGNKEVFVTNLSSVNPTQLNGSAVKQPVCLKHGDIITVIDRSFRFEKPPAQQGKRRSTGLDSDTFKVFASSQPSDTNQTVRIESLLTSKTQRKSEGNIKTTHSRRSLQISSSSEDRNDLSPFGELYEILKSKVESQKENGKTPVKDKSGSPKNVALKRSLQIQDTSQSPVAPKRSYRSQSSDSPVTRPKDVVVGQRSASAGRFREASKSPSRSPKASRKSKPIQGETEQTTRRNSSRRDSQSLLQEQVTPTVNGDLEKPSFRRSASAEQSQVATQVQSTHKNPKTPDSSTPRRRSSQSVPEQPVSKNQDRSRSKSPKGTPNKLPVTDSKTSEAEPRKSPRKRRSGELSLPEPLPKRKRVSFGGHLSPELFDKRLPPNSPLKKGATPARRSLSLNSPLAVIRRSFGVKQTVIREIFEQSESSITPTSSTKAARSSPARRSPAVAAKPSAAVKSPSPARRTVSEKSLAAPQISGQTPVKNSPAKKSPVKTPLRTPIKITPLKKSPSTKLPVKSPSIIPKRSPMTETPVLAKSSPVIKTLTPAKRSPVAKTPSPVFKTLTPVVKTATLSRRSSVAKTPSLAAKTPTPAKRSPVAKTPSTAKRSPVAKTPTPAKRSPVAKTPTPAKRSPVAKTPSPVAKTPTPAKRSPVAKTPTPAKRSPVAKTPSPMAKTLTPAKKSPVAKTPSPMAKTPTPAKRSPVAKPLSPVAKTPSPAKRSPVAKTPTLAKRSPVAKTPTPAKRSPMAKTPTPAKRSPVAKTPTPAKRSPVAKTPTTPYSKGRFSVSHVVTPPQEPVVTSRTPKQFRKSLSVMKSSRRSRKLEAFELIRSKRRSGATEANLFVSRTWADVVKIGVAKSQKKTEKPVRKVVVTKKKLKPKTPMKKNKNLTSTGHADSPATILVGRAHTRMVNLTGHVPKVVRNQAAKLDTAHNESFTGVAELFSTPEDNKQRKSNRLGSSKKDSPSSVVVEMSVMQTPEEAGEMVVSPLNSPNTTRRKQYSRDAVARLLQSPALSEVPKDGNATLDLAPQTSTSQKASRKSVGLSAVKRIMRTPKQKAAPVTDSHALRKLLRTPKESESPQAYSRRSTNLEVLGIDRLVKTPKQRGSPVNDFTGVQRIMKTPKLKSEPVVDFAGVKRILSTPKEKAQPVEDLIGIKRLMRTPKEKSQPVEDMVGIKRLMRSPKVRGQPVEDMIGIQRIMRTPKEKGLPVDDMALNHLMSTPDESVQSLESTRPIEEIFGIRNLIKTPPKSKGKEAASTGPRSQSAKSPGNASVHRGRPAKRLSLLDDSISGNDGRYTVQSPIMPVTVTQSKLAVVKSIQKRGRPSKKQSVSSLEVTKELVVSSDETSPRRRGRPSSAAKAPEEPLSSSDAEVTSSSQHRRPKATLKEPRESSLPIADRSSDGEVVSPRRRGRPSSAAKAPKESLSDAEVSSPTRRGRPKATAEEPKESVLVADSSTRKGRPGTKVEAPKESVSDAISESTSPRHRGRPSSTAKVSKESSTVSDQVAAPGESGPIADSSSAVGVSSPRRRGRPSSTTKSPKESLSASDAEVTSPSRRGRPKITAEEPKETSVPIAYDKVSSPARKGRSSIAQEAPKQSIAESEATSPRRRGRPSTMAESKESLSGSDAEVTFPTQRGRPKTTAGEPKKSVAIADEKVTSPPRKGRPSIAKEAPNESLADVVSEAASPGRRGRPSSTVKSPKESLSASDAEVTSPTRRGRPKATREEPKESSVLIPDSNSDGEVGSPKRRGRPSSAAKSPKESVSTSDNEVTSPTRRGRPKATAEPPTESASIADGKLTSPSRKESVSDAVSETTSPRRRGRPSSTAKAVKESPAVSDGEATSPTCVKRIGNKVEAPEISGPIADSSSGAKVVSPRRRGRPSSTARSPKESLSTSDAEVTSPTRRGRPKVTAEEPKESVPVAGDKVTSPARKQRPSTTPEVAKDSVPDSASEATSPRHRGRPSSTAKSPKESLSSSDAEVTSPAKRGRPKAKAEKPKESVPIANSKVTSPTRKGRLDTSVEAPKEFVVSDVPSPRRRGRSVVSAVTNEFVPSTSPVPKGRSSTNTEVLREPSPVSEATSPSRRRGRPKRIKMHVAEKSVFLAKNKLTSPARKENPSTPSEISKECVPDSKVTSPSRRGISKEPVPVAEGKTTSQTRRGRPKAKVDSPQKPSAPDVQVTRGNRSKGVAEAPKDSVPALTDAAISPKRRGRPKVTNVNSEATVPMKGTLSKDLAGKAAPVKEEIPSQKSRGRPRKTVAPIESVAEVPLSMEEVKPKSTEDVSSPPRKGRSRTTEVPKEKAVVSDVSSPKRRRNLETTEEALESSQGSSEDTNEKAAKSTKKTVRQNVKKSSKPSTEERQAPEPEAAIAPVAEKKSQLPPPRGRRKAAQNELVPSEGHLDSSLKDEHPERLSAQTSPMARRGRRRNAEEISTIEPDVAKSKTSRQEARSRGHSKSKALAEDVAENTDSVAPQESTKSPEPKSPKKSARQAKSLATEVPLESQSKILRGRHNKKDNSPDTSYLASSETEVSPKVVPARGRSRTAKDVSNVSVSDADKQTNKSKLQRGSRRNQGLPEVETKPVTSVDTQSPTRGTRGKKAADSRESHSSPEIKGKRNVRGKTVQNLDEEIIPKAKSKSVQWHPLLATMVQSATEVSAQDSTEISTRGSRSKGKAKPNAPEPEVPVKRLRRGNIQAEAEETPVSTVPESLTVSNVAPAKRGRKAKVQEKGEDTDAKSTSESTEVHTSPQRGRRASSKVVTSENNEPSVARRPRGRPAAKTPPENESTQSAVSPKSQKGGLGKQKAAESSPKPTRGVKRKLPDAKSAPLEHETPVQATESVLVETENIPASRGRRNQRNAKTQKGEVQEVVPRKQAVTSESPAKKRKTEASPTAAQKRGSRQQTSKLENEKPSAATRSRTSVRSRK